MSILYEFDEELHNRTMREIAWEEGLAQGREVGIKLGKEEGREEGIHLGQSKMIQNMLRKEKTPEDISELTDQPVEYIYQIQREMLSVVSEESNYGKEKK